MSKPRHPFRKLLFALALLTLVFVFVGPIIAAPYVRNVVISGIEEALGGSASIADLSFNATGTAHIGGLELKDGTDRPVAMVDNLDVDLGILAAIGGSIEFDLTLDGFRLELWQEEDGGWSVPSPQGDAATNREKESTDSSPTKAPAVRANVTCTNGQVLLHGHDGLTSIDHITFTTQIASLEQPARIEASLSINGPNGPAGRVTTEGQLTLAHDGYLGAEGIRGSLSIAIEEIVLATFEPLATSMLPLEGISGRLDGEARLELAGGLAIEGDSRFTIRELAIQGPLEREPARIRELVLSTEASLTPDGRGKQKAEVQLDQFFRLTYVGQTEGLGTEDHATVTGGLNLHVGAKRLSEVLRPWVPLDETLQFTGSLTSDIDLEAEFASLEILRGAIVASAGFKQLAATKDGEPIQIGALTNATFAADCRADLTTGTLDLAAVSLRAGGALEVSGQATITGLPGTVADDVPIEVRESNLEIVASLARLQRNLDLILGKVESGGSRMKGELSATLQASGSAAGLVSVVGNTTIRDFSTSVVLADGSKWKVREPKLELTLDARIDSTTGDLELRRIRLDSGAIQGDITGQVRNLVAATSAEGGELVIENIRGDLQYVPDQVAELFGPLIPGQLSGSEPEPLTFRLDARSKSLTAPALLRAAKFHATLGLGHFVTNGIRLAGEVQINVMDGVATLDGDISANGGTLSIDTRLGIGVGEELVLSSSTLSIDAQEIGANGTMAPLLANIHPAFASAKALRDGQLEGLVTTDLGLSYDGPLTLAMIAGGWQALPKEHIQGRGEFALHGAAIRGVPLFDELLAQLGLDASKSFDIPAVAFTIKDGRVEYQKPWRWSIDGVETTFSGSIGLDQTLDMNWRIPITKKLTRKQSFLGVLEGQVIDLPLHGTATSPKVDWKGTLGELAATASRRELEDRLGFGGDGDESPADRLARADELWKKGEKSEAAAIYGQLRKKFKISFVYVLNKDRIERRAKYKAP